MDKLSRNAFRGIELATVAITDYEMINPKLARVIVRCSGSMTKDERADKISALFGDEAHPVRNSFVWLDQNNTAVGFVAAAVPIRALDSKAELSKYRAVAANVYMDEQDDIWELREGAGGQYLARQGVDDLPDVLASKRVTSSATADRLRSVASAAAASHEFLSYVSGNEVDYGFVIGRNSKDQIVVYSHNEQKPIAVEDKYVVMAQPLGKSQFAEMSSKNVSIQTAKLNDAQALIDYYKKAYPHGAATGYLDKLITLIESYAAV